MNKSVQIAVGATLVALITTASSLALAKGGPFEAQIKARQGLMRVYALNLGTLAAMAKGKMPYDAKMATSAAKNLNLAAMIDGGAMWPKGSDLTNKDLTIKTAAKIEAWTTMPKVVEKDKALKEAAVKLADAAGGGMDALKPAVGAVGKSCKGCHDDFRKKAKKK